MVIVHRNSEDGESVYVRLIARTPEEKRALTELDDVAKTSSARIRRGGIIEELTFHLPKKEARS